MPRDSIFNVISINHGIISNFINIYVAPGEKEIKHENDGEEKFFQKKTTAKRKGKEK